MLCLQDLSDLCHGSDLLVGDDGDVGVCGRRSSRQVSCLGIMHIMVGNDIADVDERAANKGAALRRINSGIECKEDA